MKKYKKLIPFTFLVAILFAVLNFNAVSAGSNFQPQNNDTNEIRL